MTEKTFDLKLVEDKELFEKIKAQSDLYTRLFRLLADEFPQEMILNKHPGSKGSKISMGYRLENCPYQVLDIIRDFDENTGWNIRILNWWGHGLYLFILYGKSTYGKMKSSILRLDNSYKISDQTSPWEYKKMVAGGINIASLSKSNNISLSNYFQVFKKIETEPDFEKTYSILKKEIRFIFDNHF
jgi:hypothetical protein